MKQAKCCVCKKKVGIIPFTCKCDEKKVFCSKHRHDHNCTYDYKKEFQEKFTKENPVIKPSKIIKV
jgi:predicted nucleic acid binding AN1-type Zn finger protein